MVHSFHFNWPRFSDQFHADATQMLDAALNKGNKPRIIADRIEVVELSMGTQVGTRLRWLSCGRGANQLFRVSARRLLRPQ